MSIVSNYTFYQSKLKWKIVISWFKDNFYNLNRWKFYLECLYKFIKWCYDLQNDFQENHMTMFCKSQCWNIFSLFRVFNAGEKTLRLENISDSSINIRVISSNWFSCISSNWFFCIELSGFAHTVTILILFKNDFF